MTLEPIENEIDEPVDLVFVARCGRRPARAGPETWSIGDVDAPEPLVGGVVDLGAIATEFLMLAIDPYPRKPDAVFEPPPASDERQRIRLRRSRRSRRGKASQ